MLRNLFDPVAPLTFQEGLILVLSAIFISFVLWYFSSMVIAWIRELGKRRGKWKAKTVIQMAYLEGALSTAGLWTVLLLYCFFWKTYEGTIALVPHWAGLVVVLIIALIFLILSRRRIREVSKLLS